MSTIQTVQDTVSKSEIAYQRIRKLIIDGEYAPGVRLVLSQLAPELGVSPLPVREALRRLEAEGLIEYKHNVGAIVTRIDEGKYADEMHVLAVLEGVATALAAPELSAQDLQIARDLNAHMIRSLEEFDPVGFTHLNQQFHKVICAACPNTALREMVFQEWEKLDSIRRSTFGLIPSRAKKSVQEHALIIALIEAQASPAEIERVARQHKLHTLDAFSARSSEQLPEES